MNKIVEKHYLISLQAQLPQVGVEEFYAALRDTLTTFYKERNAVIFVSISDESPRGLIDRGTTMRRKPS